MRQPRHARAPVCFLHFALIVCTAEIPAQGVVAQSTPVRDPRPPVVNGLDPSELANLGRIEKLIQSGGAAEAIDSLVKLVRSDGDRLIGNTNASGLAGEASIPPIGPAGFETHVPVKDYCLSRLATLRTENPQAFAALREQLDGQVEKLVGQRATIRDEEELHRVVGGALVLSRYGDDALLRLGDICLERGQYSAARRFWQRIHPGLRFPYQDDPALQPAAGAPLWLPLRDVDMSAATEPLGRLFPAGPEQYAAELNRFVYPDSDIPVAELLARMALASVLEGNVERAETEIGLLRVLYGDARGRLAARDGNLVEILDAISANAAKWPDDRVSRDWPTFAGDPSRQRISTAKLVDNQKPLWTAELPRRIVQHELLSVNRVRVGESSDGLLSVHPLIVGDQIIVQTGPNRGDVGVFDRDSGSKLFPAGAFSADDLTQGMMRGVLGVNRFTPTVSGDSMFLRTGNPWLVSPASRSLVAMPTKLEALDLRAEGKLKWSLEMEAPVWGPEWIVGGAPVADGGRLYFVVSKRSALRIETHIAALDKRDGRLIWRKFIAAAEPAVRDTVSLIVNCLLTIQQGVIYCNTNHGAVAALDADSGDMLWLTSYPRTSFVAEDPDHNDLHFYRDLNPCLVYRDMVFVAPSDCERLFALDATTGSVIWATRSDVGSDAVHLLGVGGKNLIASGECLYWFDMKSGQLTAQFPESFLAPPGFARPSPRGLGRGILVGSHVYWPTEDAILVFEQDTVRTDRGWQPVLVGSYALPGNKGGNLAAANGVLVVAGSEHLTAYRMTDNTEK